MNLKEAFRYQRFLDNTMNEASINLTGRQSVALVTTKVHKKNEVNPDDQNFVEEEDRQDIYKADDLISFMNYLVEERENLSKAITIAKRSIDFDLDAAMEANKFRRTFHSSMKNLTHWKPSKRTIKGQGYKWNVENNQTPYYYDIDLTEEYAYDQRKTRDLMKETIEKADEVSSKIDKAMIETEVIFNPSFNVNDSFDDILNTDVNGTDNGTITAGYIFV